MAKFLDGVERIKITLAPRPLFDFSRTRKWIQNTVAPTLATYVSVTSLQELIYLLDEGSEKAENSKNLKEMLARARKRKMSKLGFRHIQEALFNAVPRPQIPVYRL